MVEQESETDAVGVRELRDPERLRENERVEVRTTDSVRVGGVGLRLGVREGVRVAVVHVAERDREGVSVRLRVSVGVWVRGEGEGVAVGDAEMEVGVTEADPE